MPVIARQRRGSLAATLALALAGLVALLGTQAAPPAAYVEGQVVVMARDAQAVADLHGLGYTTISTLTTGWRLVTVRPGLSTTQAVAELTGRDGIVSAQPNFTAQALLVPNDPSYAAQYHLPLLDAANAWDIAVGQASDTIAIVDTGGDSSHPDIAARVVFAPGIDIISGDSDPSEPISGTGHATSVASMAAASTNNAVNIAGVDWNARLMYVRVLDTSGNGSWYDIARGILKAVEHRATVINLSLGTDTSAIIDYAEDALLAARNANIPVIAAAGNSGASGTPVAYPASSRHAVAVGSSTSADLRASSSSYGVSNASLTGVDLVAPGDNVTFLSPGVGITTGSGTSFASPLVSGSASVLHSLRAEYNAENYRTLLIATANDLGTAGYDSFTGWGRLNLNRLVRQAQVATLFPFANDAAHTRADTFAVDPVGSERTAITAAGGRQGRRYLDVSGDNVYAGYAGALAGDTGTIEFYFRYGSLQPTETRYIVTQKGASAGKPKGSLDLVLLSDSRVQFSLQDSGVVTSTSRLHPNQWYHIAATWGPMGMILHVNGESQASRSVAGGPPAGDTVYLGAPSSLNSARSARGWFDALRFSSNQRRVFPSALEARIEHVTNQALNAVHLRWTALKNETSPTTVDVYVDRDSVGFDGTLIAANLANDGSEAISLTALNSFGSSFYIYLVAKDGNYPTELARVYSDTAFQAFSSLSSLVKGAEPRSDNFCVLARLAGPGTFLDSARAARDRLLATTPGRLLVQLYYLLLA